MFLTIGGVLSADNLRTCQQEAGKLEWRDGAATAGASAKQVKRNAQADLSSDAGRKLSSGLLDAIRSNDIVQVAARPRKFSPLLLSKTGKGGGYGAHVDNALMGQGQNRMRSDLSFTLFLSDPHSYEGGELSLDLPAGVQKLKPIAGDMVLYPSTLIHQVEPVTDGERLVAVGWIESEIRNREHRQILFDLEQVRTTLRAKGQASPELLVLDKAISNLLRQWVSL